MNDAVWIRHRQRNAVAMSCQGPTETSEPRNHRIHCLCPLNSRNSSPGLGWRYIVPIWTLAWCVPQPGYDTQLQISAGNFGCSLSTLHNSPPNPMKQISFDLAFLKMLKSLRYSPAFVPKVYFVWKLNSFETDLLKMISSKLKTSLEEKGIIDNKSDFWSQHWVPHLNFPPEFKVGFLLVSQTYCNAIFCHKPSTLNL